MDRRCAWMLWCSLDMLALTVTQSTKALRGSSSVRVTELQRPLVACALGSSLDERKVPVLCVVVSCSHSAVSWSLSCGQRWGGTFLLISRVVLLPGLAPMLSAASDFEEDKPSQRSCRYPYRALSLLVLTTLAC